ncbi:MAG: fused MFS/spermidine synthase [Caldilinea sp.]|nr:fused MFS/spermidine synthase [Caldilinea sp.]MDW8441524.1 fused MFS/spermidine synthase [Caldilineaceae bacterium]
MRSLYLLVFTAGLVTLGMELSAARLLEPAFGNSQIVWAAIIGLILLSLSVGAWLGGRLADRHPRREALELTLTIAALGVALIPLTSAPVLRLASHGMASFAADLLLGALLAVGLLFAGPAILLGAATPWAVRIAMSEQEKTFAADERGLSTTLHRRSPLAHLGRTAGRLSAVATAGSLIGAFLPVLWLIPTFGTRWTFYLLAATLLAVIALSARRRSRWLALAALLGVLAAAWWQPQGVRAAWDDGRSGEILYEDESAFNYIAVRRWGNERHLKLNDGVGIHSVYHPDALLSQGIWDYFLLAPLFRKEPPRSLLLVGAAAGTVAGLYTTIYGDIPIVGVELDPDILRVGEQWFGATWPNYTPVAADGRRWLAQQADYVQFDVIAVDAYRPPYIPFHLTTVEFFALVRDHLTEDGVVAVNVGRTDANYALVDAMAATLQEVFPSVFVIDEPGPPATLANSLVIATKAPTTLEHFRAAVAALPETAPDEWIAFAQQAAVHARMAAPPPTAPIFTDDRSQVEQIVHSLILDFLLAR